MARYIDADKAIFELGIEDWEIDCKYFIEEQPTADVVEVVHGEWESVNYTAHCSCGKSYKTVYYSCSACKHVAQPQPYGLNYCPKCGAKMDGKKVQDE